jgi:hypothetical protein
VNNLNKVDSKYVHKVNADYVLISDIKPVPKEYIDKDAAISDTHRYLYSIALPKFDCLFCFDHELDHLPFIMAIELIRQAGIATGHIIHGIPVSGYSNIMDNIKLNILKFIELDVPLIMIMEDIMLKNRSSRQERFMHFYLYQNKMLCANIEVNASVMEKDIYTRLRLNSRAELIRDTDMEKNPATNVQMLNTRHNKLIANLNK